MKARPATNISKNKPNLIAGTKTSSSLAIVARRPVDHNLKGEEHSNRLSIDYPTNGQILPRNQYPSLKILKPAIHTPCS